MLDLVSKVLWNGGKKEDNDFSCCIENSTGNILVVDVRCDGDFEIQIWAHEFGTKDYHPIAMVDKSNMGIVNNITSSGIYTVSANAIQHAVVMPNSINGNLVVTAKFGTTDAEDWGKY